MDLFGDLPSAKSAQNECKAPQEQSKGGCGASESSGAAAGEANQSTPSAANAPQSTSLVESIGNAGTTFAFVPAALRRKKPAATSAGGLSGAGPGAKRPRTAQAQGAGLPSSHAQQQLQEDIGTKTSTTSSTTPPLTRAPEGIQNQEPEWLRQLHASVQPQDRYDPLVPNDYLAFRERQAHEQEQIRMERAAKEQLEVQRRVRERIEEERRAAEEAGDLDRIVESRAVSVAASVGGAGRGRGRGRGTSNLPAWLVKKQQEENEKNTGGLN